jgi:hypothetical protein
MKTPFFFSVLLLANLVSSGAVHAEVKTVILKPETIFTPKSFDSNDNAQLVIAGAFTGYCMKIGSTDSKVDVVEKKIYIRQSASVNGNCMDLEMYIPYSTVINLGTLPKGIYKVLALQEDQAFVEMAILPIQAANYQTASGSDERLYAPASSLSFSTKNSVTSPTLTLNGYFTNTCLSLDSIEVYLKSNNVLEVLPLAKVVKGECKSEARSFTKSIQLKYFPAKDTLIHVRAMNGQSLNKVITNLDRI